MTNWEKYGPNGRSVEALLEIIGKMTPEQNSAVGNAYLNAGIYRGPFEGILRDENGALLGKEIEDNYEGYSGNYLNELHAATRAIRHQYRALIFVGEALVGRNIIPEETYNDYIAPWESVMGPVPNYN